MKADNTAELERLEAELREIDAEVEWEERHPFLNMAPLFIAWACLVGLWLAFVLCT